MVELPKFYMNEEFKVKLEVLELIVFKIETRGKNHSWILMHFICSLESSKLGIFTFLKNGGEVDWSKGKQLVSMNWNFKPKSFRF